MATTAQNVFDLAMDLLDERLESGSTDTNNTSVFKVRTPGLLTLWQNEMALGLLITAPNPITALTDTMTIVYPDNAAYYLAAHLSLVEDPSTASFFNERFIETKAAILRKQPSTIIPITDVYADTELNAFNDAKSIDCNY